MIYNGNYKNDTINDVYGIIYDSFVEFYGKQFKSEIKQKFERIRFVIYHTRDAIVEYYINYLSKFRDRILDRFYEKCKMERDEKIDDILFGKNTLISETKLNIACEGGEDVFSNDSFSSNSTKKILKCRREITKLLGLSLDSKHNYRQLMSLRNLFLECVKEIENENNCDVFDDIRTIDKNIKTNLRDFIYDACKYLKISENDRKLINSKKFDINYMYLLDCNHILFDNSIEDEGLVTAFTENANDIMKKGSKEEKLEIMIKRLMYLNYIGVDTHLDNKTLRSYKNKIHSNTNDGYDFWIYQVSKEYNYQKSRKVENKFVNISQKEFEKSWKNGNFIPTDMAEDMEDLRKFYSDNINENTKFPKTRLTSTNDNFTNKHFKDHNLFCPRNTVVLCEDYLTNTPNSYLEILIHEINHAVSEVSPYKVTKDRVTVKNSLSYNGYAHRNLIIKDKVSVSDTRQLEEFVNQMQAKEILKIVKRKMQEKNIKIQTDRVTKPSKDQCKYDYYAILAMPFYRHFREQLKLQNIDPTYRLYFDFDLPYSREQLITERVKDKLSRTFDSSYSKEGSVDFYKAEELSKLIKRLDKNILPEVFNSKITLNDFLAGRIDSLSPESKIELAKLEEKADKVMYKIYEDEKRFKER